MVPSSSQRGTQYLAARLGTHILSSSVCAVRGEVMSSVLPNKATLFFCACGILVCVLEFVIVNFWCNYMSVLVLSFFFIASNFKGISAYFMCYDNCSII